MKIEVTSCYEWGNISRAPGQVIDVYAEEFMFSIGGGKAKKAVVEKAKKKVTTENKPVVKSAKKKVTTKRKRKAK